MIIRIGTRASQLALTQTKWVMNRILDQHADVKVELIKIITKGDRIVDKPLSSIGGKGLFVKEIEEAMIRKEIDVAVHSLKDVPAELPEDLFIGIIPEREDPHDVLISKNNTPLKDLPKGSSIGTSSLRRSSQLLNYRPDLKIVPLRGNLDTRLRKLETTDIDGIILAAAGLKRLGLANKITESLPFDLMLPAVAQGSLGLELRRNDEHTRDILRFLDHYPARLTTEAERSFLARLEGGCQVPIAGFAEFNNDTISMKGLVADIDGSVILREKINGPPEQAVELGKILAEKLLDKGAKKILDNIYCR